MTDNDKKVLAESRPKASVGSTTRQSRAHRFSQREVEWRDMSEESQRSWRQWKRECQISFERLLQQKQPACCVVIASSVDKRHSRQFARLVDVVHVVASRRDKHVVDLMGRLLWWIPGVSAGEAVGILQGLFERLDTVGLDMTRLAIGGAVFPGLRVTNAQDLIAIASQACVSAPRGQVRLVQRSDVVYSMTIQPRTRAR